MKLFHAKFAERRHGKTRILEEDFYLSDEKAVRRRLREQGYYPISVDQRKEALFTWSNVRSRAWQLQLLKALRFQGGLSSLGTALLNIIEAETDPKRRLAFLPARTVLKGGGSFSDALKSLKLFDAATMAIITAGERAGDLKGVIQHAIEHTEEKGKSIKMVMTVLGWLAFDIINIVGFVWAAQFGFIPYLKQQGVKTTDPAAIKRFEEAISIASAVNMTLLVLVTTTVIMVIGFAALYWFNRYKPEHFTSKLLLRMPIMSDYLRNISMKDGCKLITRLIRGKVPLADAIDIISSTTTEASCRVYWLEAKKRIMAGAVPAKALARWPLNKGEIDQLLTAQSSDQLAEVYAAIAEERDFMAKAGQRRLFMTGIIFMIVMAVGVVLSILYLLMVQNQSFLDNISELRT
ncbi:MAG: type II secretion system F family protein [Alphaproteobacteria bacterium]|nr:type II secretion system F family protein [Alphaproteobacteria bacterium]